MEDLSKVREFYEKNIYGTWREGETVSYTVHEVSERVNGPDGESKMSAMFKLSTTDDGIDVDIKAEKNGRCGKFTVRAYIPDKALKPQNGYPFIICMHPVEPLKYALEKGVAMIFMDTSMVALDNNSRKGAFYDIYPYGADPAAQTGVLMAWAWGAAKILDAIYGGLGRKLGLDAARAAVTGVSRWGKATAVCGAFDKRFKTVIPVCSGAGGLALWNYASEGKTYDLTHCGGPSEYTYGENEPLSCLQSESEQGWFNDEFLKYKSYAEIPVEQYMLPVLAADASRQYIIVASWMGEDWVNGPAMWECYIKALALYEELGLKGNIHAAFHKEGHALLKEDLEKILPIMGV